VIYKTVTATNFLRGELWPTRSIGRHDLTARWVEGKGIEVVDPTGNRVDVCYASTADCWTCYAYLRTSQGSVFIGGWQHGVGPTPTRKRPPKFENLVEAINAGRTYTSTDQLPLSCGRNPRRR
jgi:hypothetical protein